MGTDIRLVNVPNLVRYLEKSGRLTKFPLRAKAESGRLREKLFNSGELRKDDIEKIKVQMYSKGQHLALALYILHFFSYEAYTTAIDYQKRMLIKANDVKPKNTSALKAIIKNASNFAKTITQSDNAANSSAPAASEYAATSSAPAESEYAATSSAPAASEYAVTSSAPAASEYAATFSAPAASEYAATSSAPAASEYAAASSVPAAFESDDFFEALI